MRLFRAVWAASIVLASAALPGCGSAGVAAKTPDTSIQADIEAYCKGAAGRIGVAVITDRGDTVAYNGRAEFPMQSVVKFPQALFVAKKCEERGIAFSDTINILAGELMEDTWSLMTARCGKRDMRLPVGEVLRYSLQESDNNACDILFRFAGAPDEVENYLRDIGFREIRVGATEADMHRDNSLSRMNSSTPLEMASLASRFCSVMRHSSAGMTAISEMMETCATGTARLTRPLEGSGAVTGHKTGTGFTDAEGRVSSVNDAGYITLPDGRRYAIAVFVSDAVSLEAGERIIADISEMVYEWFRRQL